MARLRRLKTRIFLGALAVVATLALTLNVLDLSFGRPHSDGAQNVTAAYNLLRHGVIGTVYNDDAPVPNNWREPLQPLLFAAAIVLHPGLEADSVSYHCLIAREPECLQRVAYLKLPSILLGILAAVGMALLVHRATQSAWLALLCFVAIVFCRSYVLAIDRYYSEGLGAFLIVVVSVLPLCGTQGQRRSSPRYLLLGGALALLILTKALFLYLVALYVVLIVADHWYRTRSLRHAWRAPAMLVAPIALLVGSWMFRNYLVLDTASVTGRSGLVLYTRASMNEVLYPHKSRLAAYYAGGPFTRNALQKGPRKTRQDFTRRLHDAKHALHERTKALRKQGFGITRIDRSLAKEARRSIAQHWQKHLALMLPVALRGMQLTSGYGFENEREFPETLSSRHLGFSLPQKVLATPYYFGWLAGASLGLCFCTGLASAKRRWLLWLTLPSSYAFAMYVGFTHFISRYATPLLPVLLGTLALCVWCALCALRRALLAGIAWMPRRSLRDRT